MTFLDYVKKVATHFFVEYINPNIGAAAPALKDTILINSKLASVTHKDIVQGFTRMKDLIQGDLTPAKAVELRALLWEYGDKFLTGVFGATTSASYLFLIASYMDLKEQELKDSEQVKEYARLKDENAKNPKKSSADEKEDSAKQAKRYAYAGNMEQVKASVRLFFPEESYGDTALKYLTGNSDKQLRYIYSNKSHFSEDTQKLLPKINPELPWQLQPAFAWLYFEGKFPERDLMSVIEIRAGISIKELSNQIIARLTAEHNVHIESITSKDEKAKSLNDLSTKAATQKAEDDKQISALKTEVEKLRRDYKLELEAHKTQFEKVKTEIEAKSTELVTKLNADHKTAFEKLKTENDEKIIQLQKKLQVEHAEVLLKLRNDLEAAHKKELAEKEKTITVLKEQLTKVLTSKDAKDQQKSTEANPNASAKPATVPNQNDAKSATAPKVNLSASAKAVPSTKKNRKKKHLQQVDTKASSKLDAFGVFKTTPPASPNAIDDEAVIVSSPKPGLSPAAEQDT